MIFALTDRDKQIKGLAPHIHVTMPTITFDSRLAWINVQEAQGSEYNVPFCVIYRKQPLTIRTELVFNSMAVTH